MKFRKRTLLSKIEGTYGTDASPADADAILTSGLAIRPLEGGAIGRELDRQVLGGDQAIHVGSHVGVSFGVELAGAGAAGDVPAYGNLLRACGFAETVNAGTDVQYDPVSASFESVSQHFALDGQRHKVLGARGTFELAFEPRAFPRFTFDFEGLWDDPASAADPSPDWSGFSAPLAISNANTPTFALHGTTPGLVSLRLTLNNEVTHRDLPGDESVVIGDRSITGRVVFFAPPLATKNWFTTARANTLGALQLVHGTVAGAIVQIDAPNVQLLNPRYDNFNGDVVIQADLSLVPSDAGDDELQITVK